MYFWYTKSNTAQKVFHLQHLTEWRMVVLYQYGGDQMVTWMKAKHLAEYLGCGTSTASRMIQAMRHFQRYDNYISAEYPQRVKRCAVDDFMVNKLKLENGFDLPPVKEEY